MPEDTFQALDGFLRSGPPGASLDFLIDHFRGEGQFRLVFEARLMRKRMELGLPLIQTEPTSSYPEPARSEYDEECARAARETGELFLAEGKIEQAWPYFRAIGDPAPVADAIGRVEPGDGIDGIIGIAFQEGVHPVKGLELILAQYGMCRAITSFGMYGAASGREECIALLARHLHGEVADRLRRAIESQEGARPESGEIGALVRDRDWLFGEYDTYVDTSHLLSVLQYATDVTDRATLGLLRDLCAYGKCLSAQFQFPGQPPFESPYTDYYLFLSALLGDSIDEAVEHFRRKVEGADPAETGSAPAEVLVNLLVRLERYEDALEISLRHLPGTPASELSCPSALQICQMARDYDRLRDLARERGDLLSYAAASLYSSQEVIDCHEHT